MEALTQTKELLKTLDDIIIDVKWGRISEEYFEKSRSWLSQRMNGHLVNGKEAALTEEEIQTLKYALNDLANRIIACAEKL